MEQITAEYKVLALQYHPDKNDGNKEAEAMFQKLKVNFLIFINRGLVFYSTKLYIKFKINIFKKYT